VFNRESCWYLPVFLPLLCIQVTYSILLFLEHMEVSFSGPVSWEVRTVCFICFRSFFNSLSLSHCLVCIGGDLYWYRWINGVGILQEWKGSLLQLSCMCFVHAFFIFYDISLSCVLFFICSFLASYLKIKHILSVRMKWLCHLSWSHPYLKQTSL
jgi:hypothetical protein